MLNVKEIPWEFKHTLVIADIDEKKIINIVTKIIVLGMSAFFMLCLLCNVSCYDIK